jgi:hypothetical protein
MRTALENAKKLSFGGDPQEATIVVYEFLIEGLCPQDRSTSQSVIRAPILITVTTCGRRVEPSAASGRPH